MTAVADLQSQLDDLYQKRLAAYSGDLSLSYPLLPVVTERYLENRVVILGQETNTWYRSGPEDLRDGYLADDHTFTHGADGTIDTRYNHFMRHVRDKGYGGKFWAFARSLYGGDGPLPGPMIGEDERLGHVWLNLFSAEAMTAKNGKAGLPTRNVKLREALLELQGDLLGQTLCLLQPQLVVSCTGPHLDSALARSLGPSIPLALAPVPSRHAPIPKKSGEPGFTEWQLAKASLDLGEGQPTTLVRTYHPTYFMGYINGQRRHYALASGQATLAGSYTATVLDEVRRAMDTSV